jgi:glycerol-3-phosphate dehydrogenase
VELLLREGCALCPSLANTRILRAYAGVRPLVASDDDPTGRSISRGIVCLDHAKRDGLDGFVTITGGKLMTYRLMAEQATDAVCRKLGITEPCRTADLPLPGSESPELGKTSRRLWTSPTLGQKASVGRQGSRAALIDFSSEDDRKLVCECENVTLGEIRYAVDKLGVRNLGDLRRRTRVGMGTCQGTFCIHKAAAALATALGTPEKARELAKDYLNERWKGMRPVGWGDTLREMEFMQKVYKEGLPYTYEV